MSKKLAKKETKKQEPIVSIDKLFENVFGVLDPLKEIREQNEELKQKVSEEEPYEQFISWNTEALIELSKILDLPDIYTIIIVEEDYDMIIEETLEETQERLENTIIKDKNDIFRYRLENERVISRIAKNNLEDIINKLLDLYKEFTKNKIHRRGCFHMEGVELLKVIDNTAIIHFCYGT